jgi:O-antigen ligase
LAGVRIAPAAAVALVVLPWLWPFTPGPSTNAVPLMAAWACVAFGLLLQQATGARIADAAPRGWLVAAVISACIGLAQWAGLAPDSPLVSSAAIGEAYGNLRQRNQFASLMSIGIAAAVWRSPASGRGWTFALVALLATANAATASRTGFVQLLLLAGFAAGWTGPRRHRLQLLAVAITAYALATVLLPQLLLAWHGVDAADVLRRAMRDLGCSSRLVLWSNVLDLIRVHPVTGWGVGELDYAHFVTLYAGPRFCDILDNAHNLPLHLAVELGVPIAVGATAGVVAAIWRARPWREADPDRQLAWAALALVAFHSLLEYPLWYGPFQALVLQAVLVLTAPRAANQHQALRRLPLVAAAAMLVALMLAAYSYARVTQAYLQPGQRWPAYRSDPAEAARGVWLFESQRRFAELAVTPLTAATAAQVHALALEMLHYSPEPTVVEKVIESALLLRKEEDAAWYALRYRAAFPDRYRAWMAGRR